jgi:hypothetical protein
MFANPTNVGISQRVVATLVACAVVLTSIGVYNVAQAANLTGVIDTLTESAPSLPSNHTIAFTIPTGSAGVPAGGTITVAIPSGFTGVGSLVFTDLDLKTNGTDRTLVAGAPGATANWGYTVSGNTITLTAGSAATPVTAGQAVEIQIGTNATTPTTGANQITNHATAGASYELVITAGTADSGRTRVAIVNSVNVTAIVDTTFDFRIIGIATSTAINGTSTTGSTSPTLIAFGKLIANQIKTLGQQLTVTTNARNGFVVTVESDGNLESSNGAIIDNFDDGVEVTGPGTAWNAPANNINSALTWGHWGVTTNDSNRTGGAFASNQYMAASTTPRIVFDHNGPADGSTQDIGQAELAYQVQVTPLQEAAQDYQTTLTYIATPTF